MELLLGDRQHSEGWGNPVTPHPGNEQHPSTATKMNNYCNRQKKSYNGADAPIIRLYRVVHSVDHRLDANFGVKDDRV